MVGRFTTVDPAKDGLNWYAYCNNNPVAFVDPLGLRAESGLGITNERSVAPIVIYSAQISDTLSKNSTHESSSEYSGYDRAIYVVDYSLNTGLPFVGHCRIYFLNNNGDMYMTEFTAEYEKGDSIIKKKKNARLFFETNSNAYNEYLGDMENYNSSCWTFKFKGIDYIELAGDFSKCVAKAENYNKTGYRPKYNLFKCNCLDYIQDLLSVAEIDDNLDEGFIVEYDKGIVPALYLWHLKMAYSKNY